MISTRSGNPENPEHNGRRRNLEIALSAAQRSLASLESQIDFAERQVEGFDA